MELRGVKEVFDKILEWIQKFVRKENAGRVFTLSEYLDIVSQYTDSAIMKEEKTGNYYTGGDCRATVINSGMVEFCIRMYFMNSNEERLMKKANRKLSLSNFDEETQAYLREESRVFEILKPEVE